MLNSILVNKINPLIEEYVQTNDGSSFQIKKWQGIISREGLILKQKLLDLISEQVGIPLILNYGYIGKVTINIPWNELWTKPCTVQIQDIHLLVTSSPFYNRDLASQMQQKIKIGKVQELVEKLENNQEGQEYREGGTPNNFLRRLFSPIVESLQLSIEGIHIRFEDSEIIRRGEKLNFGVILDKFIYSPTNSDLEQQVITLQQKHKSGISYASLHLFGLGIYWNSKALEAWSLTSNLGVLGFLFRSRHFMDIVHDHNPDYSNFILKPCSIELFLRKNLTNSKNIDIPRQTIYLNINNVDLEIQEEFYRDLHHCISFASYHQGKGEHLKLRPPFHIKPHDSPKLYWQYAISAVLLIIRKQKLNKINISQSTQKYNPSEDRHNLNNLLQYKALYSLKLVNNYFQSNGQKKSILEYKIGSQRLRLASFNELQAKLVKLEEEMEIRDLVIGRRRAIKTSKKKIVALNKKGGLFSWIFKRSGANMQREEEEMDINKSEYESLINFYTPTAQISGGTDSNYIKQCFLIQIKQINIILTSSRFTGHKEILGIHAEKIYLQLCNYILRRKLMIQINNFSIHDKQNPDLKTSYLLSRNKTSLNIEDILEFSQDANSFKKEMEENTLNPTIPLILSFEGLNSNSDNNNVLLFELEEIFPYISIKEEDSQSMIIPNLYKTNPEEEMKEFPNSPETPENIIKREESSESETSIHDEKGIERNKIIIKLFLEKLDVISNRGAFARVINFFRLNQLGDRERVGISMAADSGDQQLAIITKIQDLGEKTKLRLKYIMENTRELNLAVNCKGINLVIPGLLTTEESPVFLLSVGGIKVHTMDNRELKDLLNPFDQTLTTIKEIFSKYSEDQAIAKLPFPPSEVIEGYVIDISEAEVFFIPLAYYLEGLPCAQHEFPFPLIEKVNSRSIIIRELVKEEIDLSYRVLINIEAIIVKMKREQYIDLVDYIKSFSSEGEYGDISLMEKGSEGEMNNIWEGQYAGEPIEDIIQHVLMERKKSIDIPHKQTLSLHLATPKIYTPKIYTPKIPSPNALTASPTSIVDTHIPSYPPTHASLFLEQDEEGEDNNEYYDAIDINEIERMYQKTKAMKLRLNQKIDKAPLNLYIKLSVPLIKTEIYDSSRNSFDHTIFLNMKLNEIDFSFFQGNVDKLFKFDLGSLELFEVESTDEDIFGINEIPIINSKKYNHTGFLTCIILDHNYTQRKKENIQLNNKSGGMDLRLNKYIQVMGRLSFFDIVYKEDLIIRCADSLHLGENDQLIKSGIDHSIDSKMGNHGYQISVDINEQNTSLNTRKSIPDINIDFSIHGVNAVYTASNKEFITLELENLSVIFKRQNRQGILELDSQLETIILKCRNLANDNELQIIQMKKKSEDIRPPLLISFHKNKCKKMNKIEISDTIILGDLQCLNTICERMSSHYWVRIFHKLSTQRVPNRGNAECFGEETMCENIGRESELIISMKDTLLEFVYMHEELLKYRDLSLYLNLANASITLRYKKQIFGEELSSNILDDIQDDSTNKTFPDSSYTISKLGELKFSLDKVSMFAAKTGLKGHHVNIIQYLSGTVQVSFMKHPLFTPKMNFYNISIHKIRVNINEDLLILSYYFIYGIVNRIMELIRIIKVFIPQRPSVNPQSQRMREIPKTEEATQTQIIPPEAEKSSDIRYSRGIELDPTEEEREYFLRNINCIELPELIETLTPSLHTNRLYFHLTVSLGSVGAAWIYDLSLSNLRSFPGVIQTPIITPNIPKVKTTKESFYSSIEHSHYYRKLFLIAKGIQFRMQRWKRSHIKALKLKIRNFAIWQMFHINQLGVIAFGGNYSPQDNLNLTNQDISALDFTLFGTWIAHINLNLPTILVNNSSIKASIQIVQVILRLATIFKKPSTISTPNASTKLTTVIQFLRKYDLIKLKVDNLCIKCCTEEGPKLKWSQSGNIRSIINQTLLNIQNSINLSSNIAFKYYRSLDKVNLKLKEAQIFLNTMNFGRKEDLGEGKTMILYPFESESQITFDYIGNFRKRETNSHKGLPPKEHIHGHRFELLANILITIIEVESSIEHILLIKNIIESLKIKEMKYISRGEDIKDSGEILNVNYGKGKEITQTPNQEINQSGFRLIVKFQEIYFNLLSLQENGAVFPVLCCEYGSTKLTGTHFGVKNLLYKMNTHLKIYYYNSSKTLFEPFVESFPFKIKWRKKIDVCNIVEFRGGDTNNRYTDSHEGKLVDINYSIALFENLGQYLQSISHCLIQPQNINKLSESSNISLHSPPNHHYMTFQSLSNTKDKTYNLSSTLKKTEKLFQNTGKYHNSMEFAGRKVEGKQNRGKGEIIQYAIKNMCGSEINCTFGENSQIYVKTFQTVPILFNNFKEFKAKQKSKRAAFKSAFCRDNFWEGSSVTKLVKIEIKGFRRKIEINIEEIECEMYYLDECKMMSIIGEVRRVNGIKTLIIRSPMQINNNLRVPIEVRLFMDEMSRTYLPHMEYPTRKRISGTQHLLKGESILIPADKGLVLPIELSNFHEVQVRPVPKEMNYEWSGIARMCLNKESRDIFEDPPVLMKCRTIMPKSVPNLPQSFQIPRDGVSSKDTYLVLNTNVYNLRTFNKLKNCNRGGTMDQIIIRHLSINPPFTIQSTLPRDIILRFHPSNNHFPNLPFQGVQNAQNAQNALNAQYRESSGGINLLTSPPLSTFTSPRLTPMLHHKATEIPALDLIAGTPARGPPIVPNAAQKNNLVIAVKQNSEIDILDLNPDYELGMEINLPGYISSALYPINTNLVQNTEINNEFISILDNSVKNSELDKYNGGAQVEYERNYLNAKTHRFMKTKNILYQLCSLYKEQLNICVNVELVQGFYKLFIYAEYFILNNTQLPILISIKQDSFVYQDMEIPFAAQDISFQRSINTNSSGQEVINTPRPNRLGRISDFSDIWTSISDKKKYSFLKYKPWEKYRIKEKVGLNSVIGGGNEYKKQEYEKFSILDDTLLSIEEALPGICRGVISDEKLFDRPIADLSEYSRIRMFSYHSEANILQSDKKALPLSLILKAGNSEEGELKVGGKENNSGIIEIEEKSRNRVNSRSNEGTEINEESNGGTLYEFSYRMERLAQPYSKTKLLTISPRYLIINNSKNILTLIQWTSPGENLGEREPTLKIYPQEVTIFHWPDYKRRKEIACKFEGYVFSGPFLISSNAEFTLRLRPDNLVPPSEHRQEFMIVMVSISEENGVIYCTFSDISEQPPFRIENMTNRTLCLHQTDTPLAEFDLLGPYEVIPFGWTYPNARKLISIAVTTRNMGNLKIGIFNIETICKKEQITKKISKLNQEFLVEISSQNTSKIIKIMNPVDIIEGEELIRNKEEARHLLTFQVVFRQIGISVIDSSPKELCYISLNNLRFEVDISQYIYNFSLQIGGLQMDNQLAIEDEHAIIFQTKQKFHTKHREKKDFLGVKVRYLRTEMQHLDYFEFVQISLSPMILSLEGYYFDEIYKYIRDLYVIFRRIVLVFGERYKNLGGGFLPQGQGSGVKIVRNSDMDLTLGSDYVERAFPNPIQTKKLYFEKLVIKNINLTFSFSSSPMLFKDATIHKTIRFLIFMLNNIKEASFKFQSINLERVQQTRMAFLLNLKNAYMAQIISQKQLMMMLMSLGILGGPRGAFDNLCREVSSMFREFSNTPNVIIGMAKGTIHLISSSVFTLSNSLKDILDTIINGVNIFASGGATKSRNQLSPQFPKFLSEREEIFDDNRDPLTDHDIHSIPLYSQDSLHKSIHLHNKIWLQMILNEKIQYFQKKQNSQDIQSLGVFGQIRTRIAGNNLLILKSIHSVISIVPAFFAAIMETVREEEGRIEKMRPARFIGLNGRIECYSYKKAYAMGMLNKINLEVVGGEYIEDYYNLSQNAVIFTKHRIICVTENIKLWSKNPKHLQKLHKQKNINRNISAGDHSGWDINFQNIIKVQIECYDEKSNKKLEVISFKERLQEDLENDSGSLLEQDISISVRLKIISFGGESIPSYMEKEKGKKGSVVDDIEGMGKGFRVQVYIIYADLTEFYMVNHLHSALIAKVKASFPKY